MAQSPLQLKTYSYPRILCEADLDFDSVRKKASSNLVVEVRTSLNPHPENRREWRVVLDILAVSPDRSTPYKIDLQVIGFFEVNPAVPEEKIAGLVRITGASILYSGAREFVLGITSRGPWPAVPLPTISFVEPYQKEPPEERKTSPKAKPPQKSKS